MHACHFWCHFVGRSSFDGSCFNWISPTQTWKPQCTTRGWRKRCRRRTLLHIRGVQICHVKKGECDFNCCSDVFTDALTRSHKMFLTKNFGLYFIHCVQIFSGSLYWIFLANDYGCDIFFWEGYLWLLTLLRFHAAKSSNARSGPQLTRLGLTAR